MKIVTDHGFPKGTMPGDDPFDLFKNERDYVAKIGKSKMTVAAMDWAASEIERLKAERDKVIAWAVDCAACGSVPQEFVLELQRKFRGHQQEAKG